GQLRFGGKVRPWHSGAIAASALINRVEKTLAFWFIFQRDPVGYFFILFDPVPVPWKLKSGFQ
ncbi:MAG: hypothetical protein GY950_25660, partial [bacterium]|nr:hypothetical protein [bacterium]